MSESVAERKFRTVKGGSRAFARMAEGPTKHETAIQRICAADPAWQRYGFKSVLRELASVEGMCLPGENPLSSPPIPDAFKVTRRGCMTDVHCLEVTYRNGLQHDTERWQRYETLFGMFDGLGDATLRLTEVSVYGFTIFDMDEEQWWQNQ